MNLTRRFTGNNGQGKENRVWEKELFAELLKGLTDEQKGKVKTCKDSKDM